MQSGVVEGESLRFNVFLKQMSKIDARAGLSTSLVPLHGTYGN